MLQNETVFHLSVSRRRKLGFIFIFCSFFPQRIIKFCSPRCTSYVPKREGLRSMAVAGDCSARDFPLQRGAREQRTSNCSPLSWGCVCFLSHIYNPCSGCREGHLSPEAALVLCAPLNIKANTVGKEAESIPTAFHSKVKS